MTQPATGAADQRGGALRELAEDPSSRKRFLRMMGGAGAASALAIFVAACGDDDDSGRLERGRRDDRAGEGRWRSISRSSSTPSPSSTSRPTSTTP